MRWELWWVLDRDGDPVYPGQSPGWRASRVTWNIRCVALFWAAQIQAPAVPPVCTTCHFSGPPVPVPCAMRTIAVLTPTPTPKLL